MFVLIGIVVVIIILLTIVRCRLEFDPIGSTMIIFFVLSISFGLKTYSRYKLLKLICSKFYVSIDRDSYYNLQVTPEGVGIKKKGRRFDVLVWRISNGNIDSSGLLSIVGFSFNNYYYPRSKHLFYVPFYIMITIVPHHSFGFLALANKNCWSRWFLFLCHALF